MICDLLFFVTLVDVDHTWAVKTVGLSIFTKEFIEVSLPKCQKDLIYEGLLDVLLQINQLMPV